MRALCLFPLLVLSACVSMAPGEVDTRVRAYEGLHINELMSAWGPPTNQYQAAGKQYFSWSSQEVDSGGPSFGIGIGGYGSNVGGSVGTTVGGGVRSINCVRSAELDAAGKVAVIRWNGDPGLCAKVTPRRT